MVGWENRYNIAHYANAAKKDTIFPRMWPPIARGQGILLALGRVEGLPSPLVGLMLRLEPSEVEELATTSGGNYLRSDPFGNTVEMRTARNKSGAKKKGGA